MKLLVFLIILFTSVASLGSIIPDELSTADCAKSSLSYGHTDKNIVINCKESKQQPSSKDTHQDEHQHEHKHNHCYQHCMHYLFGILSSNPNIKNLEIDITKFFEIQKYTESSYLDSLFRPPIS